MWAGGGLSIDEGPLEALKAWGASQEVVDEWRRNLIAQAREGGVDIWPQHWHAWSVFHAMRTQWRVVGGFGGLVYIGLDKAALPIALAQCRRLPDRLPLEDLMPQLDVLEHAALAELNRE